MTWRRRRNGGCCCPRSWLRRRASRFVLLQFGDNQKLNFITDRRGPNHLGQPEIAALERRLGREAELIIVLAQRTLHPAVKRCVKGHRLGDARNRKIADNVSSS